MLTRCKNEIILGSACVGTEIIVRPKEPNPGNRLSLA